MRANQGLSKAYECEDTLQFLDETLTCYKQMLKKEIAFASRNRASGRDCSNDKEPKRRRESSRKEIVFKNWLERTLEGRYLEGRKDGIGEDPFRKELKNHEQYSVELLQLESEHASNSFSRSDNSRGFSECTGKNIGNFLATDFHQFSMDAIEAAERQQRCDLLNSPDIPLSLVANRESVTNLSCSSFYEEDPSAMYPEDDEIFDGCYNRSIGDFQLVPLKGDGLKSRPGSWSDSGYCCDRSDSDNSRFNSLSFSDCQNTKDYGTRGSSVSKDFEACGGNEIELDISDFSKALHHVNLNDTNKHVSPLGYEGLAETARSKENIFDGDHYTPEELQILTVLLNNPENSNEETKELSDIGKDVSSKGWKRRPSKAKLNIGQFFRKIIGNNRKNTQEKRKIKTVKKGISEPKDNCESLKSDKKAKVKSLRRPLSPFAKHRQRSVKTPKKSLFSLANGKKKIQRASSYSSLFGRRGSLFSHFEAAPALKRSLSSDTLQMLEPKNLCEEANQENTRSKSATPFHMQRLGHLLEYGSSPLIIGSCHMCLMSGTCCDCKCPCGGEEDWRHFQSTLDDDDDDDVKDGLIAPLKIKKQEERSALTRKIIKLRDDF